MSSNLLDNLKVILIVFVFVALIIPLIKNENTATILISPSDLEKYMPELDTLYMTTVAYGAILRLKKCLEWLSILRTFCLITPICRLRTLCFAAKPKL